MKKVIILTILISLLTPQFSLLPASANNYSSIEFTLIAAADFEDGVIVRVASNRAIGGEVIYSTLELTKENGYTGKIENLYPTEYSLSHQFYKKGDAEKSPYKQPDYELEYKSFFTLYSNSTYKMQMETVPLVSFRVPTPTPQPPPPATPAPTPKPQKTNFFPFHTFLFWTLVVGVFGCVVWYYVRKRQYFD